MSSFAISNAPVVERRPWGQFELLALNEQVSVKLITVAPGQRLSLQRHSTRDESWTILDADLYAEVDGAGRVTTVGDRVFVSRGTTHRIANHGSEPARFLEVAFGHFDENDIERLEDDYHRCATGRSPDATEQTSPRMPPLRGGLRPTLVRMSRFALVGGLGTVVNLTAMSLLVHVAALHYVLGAVLATEIAILHNFLMQERFVFRDLTAGAQGWRARLVASFTFNNVETAVRLPFLVLLVSGLGLYSVAMQGLTLLLAFFARFLFFSRVVYRPRSAADGGPVGMKSPSRGAWPYRGSPNQGGERTVETLAPGPGTRPSAEGRGT